MSTTMFEKTVVSEIRDYREKRVIDIKNGETPKPLDKNDELSKIVFHLVPIKAFSPSMIFNLSELHKNLNALRPIYCALSASVC